VHHSVHLFPQFSQTAFYTLYLYICVKSVLSLAPSIHAVVAFLSDLAFSISVALRQLPSHDQYSSQLQDDISLRYGIVKPFVNGVNGDKINLILYYVVMSRRFHFRNSFGWRLKYVLLNQHILTEYAAELATHILISIRNCCDCVLGIKSRVGFPVTFSSAVRALWVVRRYKIIIQDGGGRHHKFLHKH